MFIAVVNAGGALTASSRWLLIDAADILLVCPHRGRSRWWEVAASCLATQRNREGVIQRFQVADELFSRDDRNPFLPSLFDDETDFFDFAFLPCG